MPTLNAQFTDALHTTLQLAESHLSNLAASPVAATTDLPKLRRRLAKQFRNESLPPVQVISELAADVAGGILGTAGGRFFGWVIGGSLPAALAADWLTSA
jgi:hypothetical protein